MKIQLRKLLWIVPGALILMGAHFANAQDLSRMNTRDMLLKIKTMNVDQMSQIVRNMDRDTMTQIIRSMDSQAMTQIVTEPRPEHLVRNSQTSTGRIRKGPAKISNRDLQDP